MWTVQVGMRKEGWGKRFEWVSSIMCDADGTQNYRRRFTLLSGCIVSGDRISMHLCWQEHVLSDFDMFN